MKTFSHLLIVLLWMLPQHVDAQTSKRDRVVVLEYRGTQDHALPPVIIAESDKGVENFRKFYAQDLNKRGKFVSMNMLAHPYFIVEKDLMNQVFSMIKLNDDFGQRHQENLGHETSLTVFSNKKIDQVFYGHNKSVEIIGKLHNIFSDQKELDADISRFSEEASENLGSKLE